MDSPSSRSVGLHELSECISSRPHKSNNNLHHIPPLPPSPLPSFSLPHQRGLLTPSSSFSEISPVPPSTYKYSPNPPSPSPSLRQDGRRSTKRNNHPPPSRHHFLPIRASLEAHSHSTHNSFTFAMASTSISRPGSPSIRNLPLSPPYPDIPRPPSRCESLLRDTLRRADEQEKTLAHRSASRSPSRWGASLNRRPSHSKSRTSRPRGNSILSVSDGDNDENVFMPSRRTHNELEAFKFLMQDPATLTAPRTVRPRIMSNMGPRLSPPEDDDCPQSPLSPSPMPPAMTRTRTAPVIPNVKFQARGEDALSMRPAMGPRNSNDRRSYPNTASHSMVTSNQSSPNPRHSTLPPHEYALRIKLESVLQMEDGSSPSKRSHRRAISHSVVTSPRQVDQTHCSASPSPQSPAPSSLSNSATDLARVGAAQHPHSHERSFSYTRDNSSSSLQGYSNPSPPSPSNEPLTPPPTPPLTAFNARYASEICKRIDGYVSFASVEGLGEPPGMDIDGSESEEHEDGLTWGRWFKRRFFANSQNTNMNDSEDQVVVGRKRSGSSVSK